MNKVYVLYESNYGEILLECDSTYLVGVYKNREDAIKKAKENIEYSLKEYNYVLDEEENNIEKGCVRLFYNNQENWSCYYEIVIEEKEII